MPHSEIPGSPIARISPGLFAACHVLHRLSVPRHPPDALTLRLIHQHRRVQGQNPAPRVSGVQALAKAGAHKTRRPHMKTLLRIVQTPATTRARALSASVTLQTLSSPFNQHPRPRRRTAPGNGVSVFSERRASPLAALPRAPALLARCRQATLCCDRGGGERDRTDDLLLAKQALSQLSYTPVPGVRCQEPGTS